MTLIKTIIADDEEPLRNSLKSKLLQLWPEIDICGEAENGVQALEMIQAIQPDVAFLDIKMPGLSGMEVAKKIGKMCHIVFITAYERYAVEAFENEALDYLLKPVSEQRLEKTIARLKKKLASPSVPPADISSVVDRVMHEMNKKSEKKYLQWIKVQPGESIRLIHIDDVYYFQSSDKYTTVITAKGESLIKKPIKELIDELDPDRFWQIHRGTIVNVNRIEEVSPSLTGKYIVKLKDVSEMFSVSRTFTHLFKRM